MIYSHHPRIRAQVTLGPVLLALLTVTSRAAAVTDIRFERWKFLPGGAVRVSFDAKATALDVATGFRFAIAERDPGANDVLVRFAVQPCTALPTPGTDITVIATCLLRCDLGGLRADNRVDWNVSWCGYPQQRECMDVYQPAAALPSASEPEDFELVVLDENDTEGSFPTPENSLRCDPFLVSTFDEIEAPEHARSGTIGVYADPSGTICSDHIQPLVPFRWYVVAHLEGMTRCGIGYTELGVHGVPPGFFVGVTPNANAVANGYLFTTSGLAFPQCERGSDDAIVLYTLDGISNVPVQDAVLQVEGGAPPTKFWPYPWADLCPFPGTHRRRIDGQRFIINPSPGSDCELPVAVQPVSWGRLKTLYHDSR